MKRWMDLLFCVVLAVEVLSWDTRREEEYKDLQSDISMKQWARRSELMRLYDQIWAGDAGLVDEYHRLEAEDAGLRADERRQLAEANPDALSDEAYALIHGGRDG